MLIFYSCSFDKPILEGAVVVRHFRLVQKAYTFCLEHEDGSGSLTNVDQRVSTAGTIWSGTADDPNKLNDEFFSGYRLERQDFGGDTACVGDSEFLYELQELIDGKWRFFRHIEANLDDPYDDIDPYPMTEEEYWAEEAARYEADYPPPTPEEIARAEQEELEHWEQVARDIEAELPGGHWAKRS